jgi:hypothetical protein
VSVPAHHATTRHLGAAYPFASEAGLGGRGVLIGRDLLGSAFVYDPFELYQLGVITKVSIKTGCKNPGRTHSGKASVAPDLDSVTDRRLP